ncbi:unnamed protein product [Danaus chrysippus]|uniref:(African queen) hypothetical protein n=1 Tax=Danaus chrysippus TaxID=151541 RepID=A0A8J2VPZ3_9NEOP|nr:unnamed protein product [Danaus chrysippus]
MMVPKAHLLDVRSIIAAISSIRHQLQKTFPSIELYSTNNTTRSRICDSAAQAILDKFRCKLFSVRVQPDVSICFQMD